MAFACQRLLNRLVKKRAIGFRAEGKRYLYHPLLSRADCIRRESPVGCGRVCVKIHESRRNRGGAALSHRA